MIDVRMSLVALAMVALPGMATASTTIQPTTAHSVRTSADDRSDITFRSAVTIEAIQRSNDGIVRKLVTQVSSLRRQISLSRGDTVSLRSELSRSQDEMVRRLAETDARYAAERAAFAQAIASLFQNGDASVLALLHRYAAGDFAALRALQARLKNTPASPSQRLLDQRALATLVIDAVRRDERDERDQIAAYEAILRENPNDYGALLQIRGLYLSSGQIDRAKSVSGQIATIERGSEFDNAPQMRALTLGQNSLASLRSGRVEEALRFAQQGVVIIRAMAAEPYESWQSRHPGATESREVSEEWNREQLAIALGYVKEVQKARRHYQEAILSAEESASLRRININEELRLEGKVSSGAASYAAHGMVEVGDLKMKLGDVEGAMSAYRTALSINEQGPYASGKQIIEPHAALIPLARAALVAGRTEDANDALAAARDDLKRTEPDVYVLASEGEYWLAMGDLLRARGKTDDARAAWTSAEAALSQATSLKRDNVEWRDRLGEVEARLSTFR